MTESVSKQILSDGKFDGLFPGWGGTRVIAVNCSEEGKLSVIADSAGPINEYKAADNHEHHGPKLNAIFSVSIAGCDLMGSCLYTAGVCTYYSGKLAPISLLLVTVMLYFFRRVYSEVVSAIPVNGGSYNILLNTASKKMASFVACLSILSYTATAIMSAFDSVVYLALLWPSVDIRGFTIIILAAFGFICTFGVKDSATIGFVMVFCHVCILSVLIIWGFIYGIQDNFQTFKENLAMPTPVIKASEGYILSDRNPGAALYFGYCAALLGITGFETAANYVEEMESPAVFVTTVNAMWLMVGIFNPLLSLMSLMTMPLPVIYEHSSDMLAEMGHAIGGEMLRTFVCVDAVIILCGGVITAIVGVSGLIVRLAHDKVLPSALGLTNKQGGSYIAIVTFVGVAMTLFLVIFDPADPTAINDFGGVFAISFLSVLVAFAIAAIMLKLYRARIARLVIAPWWQIFLSLGAVAVGLIGNIILTPRVFLFFLAYLSLFLLIVWYMFMKVKIFSFFIWMMRKMNLTPEKSRQARQADEDIVAACYSQAGYNEREVLLEQYRIEEGMSSAAPGELLTIITTPTSSPAKRGARVSFQKNADADSGGIQLVSASSGDEKRPSHSLFTWGNTLIENAKAKFCSKPYSYEATSGAEKMHGGTIQAARTESMLEIEDMMHNSTLRPVLEYFMNSLDAIVSTPTAILTKGSDPISLHLAVEYIINNELSNNICVIHFVDDRKAIHSQQTFKKRAMTLAEKGEISQEEVAAYSDTMLRKIFADSTPLKAHHRSFVGSGEVSPDEDSPGDSSRELTRSALDLNDALLTLPSTAESLVHTVSIIDAFYTYKKIHCVIVRGAQFCPSAVDLVSRYLDISKNAMIMGVPDTKFPFPFAQLRGVRLAIPPSDVNVRNNAVKHLREVLLNSMSSRLIQASMEDRELVIKPHEYVKKYDGNGGGNGGNGGGGALDQQPLHDAEEKAGEGKDHRDARSHSQAGTTASSSYARSIEMPHMTDI